MRVNLAPDVYVKHQQDKRRMAIATTIAVGIGVLLVGVVAVELVILGGEKVAVSQTQKSIASKQAQIKTYSDLPAAVTLSQHLTSLKTLDSQRLYLSRFFTILQTVAPTQISVNMLSVDKQNVLTVSAQATDYPIATKFAKALEQGAGLKADSSTSASSISDSSSALPQYFSNVNLGAVSKGDKTVDLKITTQVASEATNAN